MTTTGPTGHHLRAVLCNLPHSSTEVPLDMLSEAAEEASRGRLGGQWFAEQSCSSSSPVGAEPTKTLAKLTLAPEGLLAGLGYAITGPNRDNCPLLLLPAPGMLQDGCYWTTPAGVVDTQIPRPYQSWAATKHEEGSPTQASESATPSAGTVTFSGGEEGTPSHEISSCDSPRGWRSREEEAATDDSVVEQQEERQPACGR